MKAACTIINKKYIPFAKVLSASLQQYLPGLKFLAAVVDADNASELPGSNGSLEFLPVTGLLETEIAKSIFQKYAHTNQDHLRWALKPILLLHLLERFENVIFVDPDVYFVGDPSFLFEDLASHDALLAPHWSETNPLKYEDGLFSVMRNGLYSGGFIGANRRTSTTLQWWAGVCHYKMDAQPGLGVFVDQKYLDLFPLKLPNAGIIRNPGCNLTNINLLTCRRSIEDGELRINKTHKPIFIHFTRDTIYNIDEGNDPLLREFLDEYRQKLEEEGVETGEPVNGGFYAALRKKFLLRTRLKRFLFRLAEKL